jgi:hypothetical protein
MSIQQTFSFFFSQLSRWISNLLRTFGANRANSVHQFVSVESGAITRNGPGAPS